MATQEAVARRRANRAAAYLAKAAKARGPKVATIATIGSTGLSVRQQRLLSMVSAQLFDQGVIDPKYLGIRFLELFALNWTPLRYVWYDNRPQLVGAWMTEPEFEEVWLWWGGLHYESRNSIMRRESMFA